MFTDYPFDDNPLGFRPRTLRALAGARYHIQDLSCADSIGIDFHKPGFAPYISSLLLVKEQDDLARLQRPQEQMRISINLENIAQACIRWKCLDRGRAR